MIDLVVDRLGVGATSLLGGLMLMNLTGCVLWVRGYRQAKAHEIRVAAAQENRE